MSKRKKRLVLGLTVAPLALGAGVWLALDAADRSGRDFYAAGRSAVECLDGLAAALGKRDPAAIGRFYSPDFAGRDLGLLHPRLVEDKDGVRALRLAAAGGREDRAGAVAAWQQYLAGFAELEEVGLHVHRLEQWSSTGDLVASVRFELIGTPHGAGPRAGQGPGASQSIPGASNQTAGPAGQGPGALQSIPGASSQTANNSPPTIDRAYFRMRFVRGPEGLAIREASLLEGERVSAERPQFRDVAHEAGIDFRNRYYPPFLKQPLAFGMIRYGPGGITAVDYDNDGFYDLFIPDGVSARLLHNRGDGTFEDVTEKAGLGGLDGVSVGVFADYDNDGFKDLFVSRTFRHNQLFHNNGDGTFTDVTARSGLGEDCCTTVASWGDYDDDGFLDLYVGRYLDPRQDIPTTFYARNGTGNRLYHNNGDGTFTDVTAKAGVADKGLCLGSAWGDYDGDGYPDLLVANDFGRSTLFHNNRDGTFDDVTVGAHTLAYGAGMSASWGDFDNDGRLDIYIADIRSEFGWFGAGPTVARYMANSWKQGVWTTDMPLYFQIFRQSGLSFVDVFSEMAAGNHLLRNRGDGTFEDVSWKAGANPVGWFWGSVFADFDNDGWLDIYSADGWVYNKRGTEIELGFLNNVVGRQKDYKTGMFFDPKNFGDQSWHGWERNRHLRNNGDGTFREIGAAAGTDLVTNSRGVAVADFWNRGALDIAVAASDDRHALLRNEVGTRRHWLQVELTGTRSNRDAVGARVSITAGGKRQLREVALGDGYASQNALRQHFGLGEAPVVEEMTVRWPASGTVQRFRNVAADRIVAVTEGKDELVEKHYRQAASAKLPLPASNSKKAISR